MKSWLKFIVTPWLGVIALTIFSILLSNFSPTSTILSIMVIIFLVIALITLPYLMLVTAPKKPYFFTIIYMLSIWIILKIINFKVSLLSLDSFIELISGSIATLLAIFIFYLKNKKSNQYK